MAASPLLGLAAAGERADLAGLEEPGDDEVDDRKGGDQKVDGAEQQAEDDRDAERDHGGEVSAAATLRAAALASSVAPVMG